MLMQMPPAKIYTPLYFDGGSWHISDSFWSEILKSLKGSSSPGVDLLYYYPVNALLRDENPEMLRFRVEEMLNARLLYFNNLSPNSIYGEIDEGPDEYPYKAALSRVETNVASPVRVFIKNEPTRTNKKGRLINSYSVVDSILERIISMKDFVDCVPYWPCSFSTIGIDLTSRELVESMRCNFVSRSMQHGFRRMASSDLQGFEYCIAPMHFDVAFMLRFKRYFNLWPHEIALGEVVNPLMKLLFVEHDLERRSKILVCSDGVVVHANISWMQSGRYETAQIDTFVRAFLPTLVWNLRGLEKYVPAIANGDDCVESLPDEATQDIWVSEYNWLGFVVTDFKESRGETLSFCSQTIIPGSHHPESILKSVIRLLSNSTITDELWDQFVFVNHTFPLWGELEEFLLSIVNVEDRLTDSEDGNIFRDNGA